MTARLEDLKPGASVKGILPDALVTIETTKWHGSVLEVIYKDAQGKPATELIYRDREPTLEVVSAGKPWSFEADGAAFRLVSEANRIHLAYLFDPLLAVHTSLVDPLPHQITAVYEEMLPRQPLRFLLADDPGAGKTIMAGLLIKELQVRGDLHRCLIVCPGMLAEQWQDELRDKFHLHFEILTNDKFESAATGNWFQENPLAICRLDKLARDEDVQAKLKQTDWDLIVCDEAHKMSASFFGGEIKETKRHKLGREILSQISRHFLLMSATPHNGKEEDFQLFLRLLDNDRFEGKYRDGVHATDASDLMRRLVKEQLLKFDGTPLFPERRAYTVGYTLSDQEALLYKRVTDYVREEFNRAEALENEGRKGTVGFALTILQRRLASSPEAIYQSLRRRRERLEKRLKEAELDKRGADVAAAGFQSFKVLTMDQLEDLDEAPDSEVEDTEEQLVDQATAAQTIAELKAEIAMLQDLEALALKVRRSGTDRKWDELSKLLQNDAEIVDAHGHRRKLVIFTEHRDTLNYLAERIRTLLGRPNEVVTIHGGMGRDDRRNAQNAFTQDKDVHILVATDAAGEGINLQRAHLMVNYDIPWNPNRLEQRFGRIHRIGQREVCHLWNLVASDTREGDVFNRLLEKLAAEKGALKGQIFDVLGKLFPGTSLRDLLIEAIRYGDSPEVKAKLEQQVDLPFDKDNLKRVIEEHALARDSMDASRVQQIREEMEKAEARRLQPHFIAEFFLEAFQKLGGKIHQREPSRYEITHVPAAIRNRDREIGTKAPLLSKYERVAFEKMLISIPGKPLAEFVCPGHPLLDATIDLVLERHRDLMKRGAVLIDPNDPGEEPRVLFYLEHSIQDARTDRAGNRRIVSRQMQFVEIDGAGKARGAGYAPYLDYRPVEEAERAGLEKALADWGKGDFEGQAVEYAITQIVPKHLEEVRGRKEELVTKTLTAVKERLAKEINYWDNRANQERLKETAKGLPPLNSAKFRERANDLEARLKKRLEELEQEKRISPLPPVALGGALVVPAGFVAKAVGEPKATVLDEARETERVERIAMDAVMETERRLGFEPRDVSDQRGIGYDIESRVPGEGRLRFIEVKGRVKGANTICVTKNEILTALNKPEDFILAIVEVDGESGTPRYVRQPFQREPDFAVTSINFKLESLLAKATHLG